MLPPVYKKKYTKIKRLFGEWEFLLPGLAPALPAQVVGPGARRSIFLIKGK